MKQNIALGIKATSPTHEEKTLLQQGYNNLTFGRRTAFRTIQVTQVAGSQLETTGGRHRSVHDQLTTLSMEMEALITAVTHMPLFCGSQHA